MAQQDMNQGSEALAKDIPQHEKEAAICGGTLPNLGQRCTCQSRFFLIMEIPG